MLPRTTGSKAVMQRYRPDIWWPAVNERNFPEPEPRMAEDSATGQYYDKDDVDRQIATLSMGCETFVEMQEELCKLLEVDHIGDSLALHDRIVGAIKRRQESTIR